jgi:hypothetical protein
MRGRRDEEGGGMDGERRREEIGKVRRKCNSNI